jgi:hypothetical protein
MKFRTAALALFGLVVSTVAARADSQQDQQACMNDAMTVCSQFIPDRERVAACLLSNRTRISAECRAALMHFNPRTATIR